MTFREEGQRNRLACLDEEALKDITAPANLNSGELQDVYRLQIDDFDEPDSLEVFYDDGRGGQIREIVFVDPIYADRRPRICVSIDGIQAMHKTISTLTRKVDNLVDTLQRCRAAYYKELITLKEQLHQQAVAIKEGRKHSISQTVLFDPQAFHSQTPQEIEMEVKKQTAALTKRLTDMEFENMRLKKRVAILSIEQTHLENQLTTRVQKMDIRDMCYDILDRVKCDTLMRTLRGLIDEHQQDLFYNTIEEVLSDHRGLKIADLLKQNQEDAEKISKISVELFKAKQDLASALREEKQTNEALMQTNKMWQNAESFVKDLEQSLEDSQTEAAEAKEKLDAARKEPVFLREKIKKMQEEHSKELEDLKEKLKAAQAKKEEAPTDLASSLSMASSKSKGGSRFDSMADMLASAQQSFSTQEQFTIACSLLKGTPSTQVTKTAELLKAVVEDARPNLLKELLLLEHPSLGSPKLRLGAAQKLISQLPEEDMASVAQIIPLALCKELAVKVLEASATQDAAGEEHSEKSFDPNIDLSKKCKWSLMRRFLKKLTSNEVKNLFDELGPRSKRSILTDIFDYQDPKDLELCAEMIFVEPSIKAFTKGLSAEANELFLVQIAQRLGEEKAVSMVAPNFKRVEASRQSVVRHHETVQTEFTCVSEELVLSRKPRDEGIDGIFLTGLPRSRTASVQEAEKAAAAAEEARLLEAQAEAERKEAEAQAAMELMAQRKAKELQAQQEAEEQAVAIALRAQEQERQMARELEAFKAKMEEELRAKQEKILSEAQEAMPEEAMAAAMAKAKEEAEAAAAAKLREKEEALQAAQRRAEKEAHEAAQRQQAAADLAQQMAEKEAEAAAAKEQAEQEVKAARAQRRASMAATEEANRATAAAEAKSRAAEREKEEAMAMKEAYELMQAAEVEARQTAADAERDALAAAQRAAEAAQAAREELDAKGHQLSEEERQALQQKADEEQAAKEAAEAAAQAAQAAAQSAQERAAEAEREMKEQAVTAQFKVIAKLSRVQAAYTTLEERFRMQEEVAAGAERREQEALKREEELSVQIAAHALARQATWCHQPAQTLLACEQDDNEKWRWTVQADGDSHALDVRVETETLAAQWLHEVRPRTRSEDRSQSRQSQSRQSQSRQSQRPEEGAAASKSIFLVPKETAQQTSPELWPQAPQLSQPNLPKPSSTVATQTDTVLGPSELSPEVPRGDWAAGVQHEVHEPRPSVEQDPSPHRAATQQGLVLAADPRSKSKPGQGPAPSLTEGMTPSTSTASLPHRGAFASVSSAMLPSASGSSIQASHNQSLELPPEPEAIRSQPNLRSHESISPVAETRLAKRKSLEDLGFVASPDRLGRDRDRLSRERELAVSPSRQVSHVSQESHELEILEAKQQFVRQISESIGQQAAAAQLGPAEAAKSAAQAAQRGAAEQGLSKEEAVEVAASCAGLAAAEAAVQLGYSPEEAALTATEQTSSTASALGLNRGQALQSAAHAVGAVIGKAAAESHWNPADAAGHAANTLRKFIDANDAHDNLIQTTATATHEAARAVALAQGAPPALAHQIGAEEASRITSQLVHQKLRFAATSAVAAASPGAGAGDAASRFVASVPRNTGSRGSEGSSSRSSRPSTKERPMSKGLGLPEALDRVPLPPLNLEKESITKSLPLAQPSRPAPVKRRFSITELTMPDTARRASRAQALEQHGSLTERQAGPRLSASEYPESARILGYARTGESPESRPAEKPERPHRGPSQEPPPFQRRASAIQLELEAVLPSTKPKLQGWQRVREKRDEKATALGLSPERGRARRASLTPRPEPPEETSSPETDRRNFAQHIQMTKVAQERPSPPRRPPGVVPQPPSSHPAGAAAAGRAMRLNLAVGKAPAPAQPLDATHALQELRARKPSSKKSTEKAQLGGDLRIDAVRPLPEARSPDRARRRQSHLPEAKSKEAPFAPDMASLFVGKEEKEKEAKRHEREVRERQASPGEAPSFTPRRVATDRLDTAEGKPFGYSPGSTVRDAEGLGNMLSVSSLNVDPKVRSSQSFHKTEGKEADVSPSRSLRGNADDASPRSRKEGKDADESPTRSLTSHIERGAARIKEAELIPSEPPKEPPKPKEPKEGEAEVLVKRVCESLDRKFGSVDAAFLSMSAKMNRLERAESLTEGDDKEDRTLLQLRGCLVESGVGHKDATLLLQAMRSGLPGQMPSLQDVANSLRPGCLQQAALDQAKKKSAFSLSGSDDPNINLDSIRGISNLDARSILERQGAPVILPLPAPPGARSRSNSPGKRSGSSSPKRNAQQIRPPLPS